MDKYEIGPVGTANCVLDGYSASIDAAASSLASLLLKELAPSSQWYIRRNGDVVAVVTAIRLPGLEPTIVVRRPLTSAIIRDRLDALGMQMLDATSRGAHALAQRTRAEISRVEAELPCVGDLAVNRRLSHLFRCGLQSVAKQEPLIPQTEMRAQSRINSLVEASLLEGDVMTLGALMKIGAMPVQVATAKVTALAIRFCEMQVVSLPGRQLAEDINRLGNKLFGEAWLSVVQPGR